jgi:hypothetical protein
MWFYTDPQLGKYRNRAQGEINAKTVKATLVDIAQEMSMDQQQEMSMDQQQVSSQLI